MPITLARRRMLSAAALSLGAAIWQGRDAAAQSRWFAEDGVAIRGTDPVAYFREGRPVRGRADITHDWHGVAWRFATTANRDTFAADPERYAPAYGGHCAWAVAQGYTAPIDPAAWKIVDGRLFLNYDRSIQQRWERDIPGFIAKADANWPALAAK